MRTKIVRSVSTTDRVTYPLWARAAVTFGTRTGNAPVVVQVFSSVAAAERFALQFMRALPADFNSDNWPAVWAMVHYRTELQGMGPRFWWPCTYAIDNGGKVAKDHRVTKRAHLRTRIGVQRIAA